MERKKWFSSQSLIIIAIILLIFSYIGVDVIKTKPKIKSDIDSIKVQYKELSTYLDDKIPEIDSTLRIQATQISSQSEDIEELNNKLKNISDE
jgi:uncharacterized protein YoxC